MIAPPKYLYHIICLRGYEELLYFDGLNGGNPPSIQLIQDYELIKKEVKKGTRHARAELRRVDALAMHNNGYEFRYLGNGIWETDSVPRSFINRTEIVYGLRDLKKTNIEGELKGE